jgi:transketolase
MSLPETAARCPVAMSPVREVLGKILPELGERYQEIVVTDADLSRSTGTYLFAAKHPKRFISVGISEQEMMGVAAGLASSGKIPIVSTYAIFAAGRGWEQIRNTIARANLNVKIVATHAGMSAGPDGASHQSLEDVAVMRVIPNMTVVMPSSVFQAEKAIEASIRRDGPFYIRLGRVIPADPALDSEFIVGKSAVVKDGCDVTIVANGLMVSEALSAALDLKKDGIEARVIDLHTIKPLDVNSLLSAARETGAIVTAEEHSVIGGLGGAVAEVLAERLPTAMEMVGVRDVFGESGDFRSLLVKHGLTAHGIAEAVRKALARKNASLNPHRRGGRQR